MDMMPLIVSAIISIVSSFGITFAYDRWGLFFFRKKDAREAIRTGPQLEIREIASKKWLESKKDDINQKMLLYVHTSEDGVYTTSVCEFKDLSPHEAVSFSGKTILRIRVVNNTNDGVSIQSLKFGKNPLPNLTKWEHQTLDAHSNISLYVDIVDRPDEMKIIYNQHILTYGVKSASARYIRANTAKLIPKN